MSLGVWIAPGQLLVAPGISAAVSPRPSTRLSTPQARAYGSQASKSAMSCSVSAKKATPPCTRPISSLVWRASACQCRFASTMIGSSCGSRPCWRIQPQLRLDCSPAMRPFSTSTARSPLRARNSAVVTPTTPPPITTTSARSDSGPLCATGLLSEMGKGIMAGPSIASEPTLTQPARGNNPPPVGDWRKKRRPVRRDRGARNPHSTRAVQRERHTRTSASPRTPIPGHRFDRERRSA